MAKGTKKLTASSKAIDPALNALFAASAGPVQAPPTSRYQALVEKKPKPALVGTDNADEEEGDDEVLSEISEELDYEDDEEEDGAKKAGEEDSDVSIDETTNEAEAVAKKAEESQSSKRERKRKRMDDNDDLEGKYLNKLAEEEDEAAKPVEKRRKEEKSGEGSDEESDEEDSEIPVHESLAKDPKVSDLDKAARTIFLSNVSSEAIDSKSAKKTLMTHLASVLDTEASPPEKVESIRFRSIAFSGGAMPKRAAYITKTLMQETTKSANAYVVYSTEKAARTAASKLNGTQVLDRHIRADSVAHPSPTDHRRCVFVGNLGFVDDETVLNTNAEGKTTEKKRNKVPADIEEGLWRTFGKQGRVENVRVVRDPKTRVGKGFAYVQFYDSNTVESALLLDGKKFPPMLPRILRVTRAKDPRKTALAQERSRAKAIQANSNAAAAGKSTKYRPKVTPEQQTMAGRTQKLLGRAAANEQRFGPKKPQRATDNDRGSAATGANAFEFKTPEQVVFEGRRASSKDGLPKDLKKIPKKSKAKAQASGRPKNRGARRAAEWKKKN